jgi:hypothetical protein
MSISILSSHLLPQVLFKYLQYKEGIRFLNRAHVFKASMKRTPSEIFQGIDVVR